ncbi:short-chain dehydrogenase [Peribacillus sp. SCS-37]|uniref:short-chain dehydrogenase n=1 Tax=Paraperibacillus esterisolvens TaxID=3115296 RepID=UPI00390697CE
MPVHEFGIIEDIDNEKNDIDYEPLKYNCISVDDNIINSLSEHLSIMKTYFHSLKRPEFGLAYWGITIIPPESLSFFYEVVTSSTFYEKSAVLNELAIKINKANEENKHMIHYGV